MGQDQLTPQGVTTLDAEQAVAGSILIDRDAYRRVSGIVTADDFQFSSCREIFQAAESLDAKNEPVDAVTIGNELKQRGLHEVIPPKYLIDLMDITPTATEAELYARITAESAQNRRITLLCTQVGKDTGSGVNDRLGRLQAGVEGIANRATLGGILSTADILVDLVDDMQERMEGNRAPISCGLKAIDKPLGGGLSPGALYILAGRPGMGKTTLGLFLADQLSKRGPVLYVSLEMTPRQLAAKRVARAASIPVQRLLFATKDNEFTPEEWDKVTAASSRLTKENDLKINQKMGVTVSEIGVMARQIKGLQAVFVDHLGLLRSVGKNWRGRTEMITEISGSLKRLALSLEVPVVALCQLNRASEQNEGKRPTLANLRDSGSIEQDADVVMLLHREDYYKPDAEKRPWDPSFLEVSFAKNRFGRNETGYLSLYLSTDKIIDA